MTNTVDKFNEQDKHIDSYTWKTQEWVQRCTKQLTFWSSIFFKNRWFFKPMVSAECPFSAGSKPSQKNLLLAYFEESPSKKRLREWQRQATRQSPGINLSDSFVKLPTTTLKHLEILWKYLFLWYSLRNWTPCNQRIGIKKMDLDLEIRPAVGGLTIDCLNWPPSCLRNEVVFRSARWWQGMPWCQRNTPAVQSTNGFWTKTNKVKNLLTQVVHSCFKGCETLRT